MPNLPLINKCLAIAVKYLAKPDIKFFWFSLILLVFLLSAKYFARDCSLKGFATSLFIKLLKTCLLN